MESKSGPIFRSGLSEIRYSDMADAYPKFTSENGEKLKLEFGPIIGSKFRLNTSVHPAPPSQDHFMFRAILSSISFLRSKHTSSYICCFLFLIFLRTHFTFGMYLNPFSSLEKPLYLSICLFWSIFFNLFSYPLNHFIFWNSNFFGHSMFRIIAPSI